VIKESSGNVTELRCTYDPATKGGNAPDGRKVKGTIHWVSAAHAIPAEVRLYDHLCKAPHPEDVPEGQDFLVNLNPNSLEVLTAMLEPSLAFSPLPSGGEGPGVRGPSVGEKYQFERLGYFSVDKDSAPGKLVFNRAVTLADTWAKMEKKGK
jgi:glutaminyl-tRNA synthetase